MKLLYLFVVNMNSITVMSVISSDLRARLKIALVEWVPGIF